MISHIPREENMKEDSLAKLASTGDAQMLGLVPVEVLSNPSTDDNDIDWIMETAIDPDSWMTPIQNYLLRGELPDDSKKRKRLLRKASLYLI